MSSTKSDKRLYVGNLSVSVDEYALMQVCSKYGKIAKLDYLFHKSGPQRGQPRGYAFVEYATSNEAQLAQATLHNKVLRGRKLVVSLASEQEPKEPTSLKRNGTKYGGGGPIRGGGNQEDSNRPTAISLLKGGQGGGVAMKNATTNTKIAHLEAKLAHLKQQRQQQSSSSSIPATRGGNDDAQHFLDDLLPNPRTGGGETTRDGIKAARLPARPSFESRDPPRKL